MSSSNSDALQNLSDERRAAVTPTDPAQWPVGGDPVPEATTSAENADVGDIPSGRITGQDTPDAPGTASEAQKTIRRPAAKPTAT